MKIINHFFDNENEITDEELEELRQALEPDTQTMQVTIDEPRDYKWPT